jgi:hypothetical protein
MGCPDKVPVTDDAIQKKEELRQNIGKNRGLWAMKNPMANN